MNVQGKSIVVTGGAKGIGKALCQRFAKEGARGIVVADIDGKLAAEVAGEIDGMAVAIDVSNETDMVRLVQHAIDRYGQIDLFCSNAGIMVPGGADASDADWARIMGVNVMAHIYAVRAVLPAMLARGEGYFLQTVSAAGLLSQIGSAPYSVTKHAAIGFAEWLSIMHGGSGIKVSALCPQGVRTDMLFRAKPEENFLLEGSVTPEHVAESVIQGLACEQFLILPHPEVSEYFRRKADDYDRWLRGMRRLQDRITSKKAEV